MSQRDQCGCSSRVGICSHLLGIAGWEAVAHLFGGCNPWLGNKHTDTIGLFCTVIAGNGARTQPSFKVDLAPSLFRRAARIQHCCQPFARAE